MNCRLNLIIIDELVSYDDFVMKEINNFRLNKKIKKILVKEFILK